MPNEHEEIEKFDEYLVDGSKYAALVLREELVSVEGEDAPIFPPTFAKPQGIQDEDWSGYNIDSFADGSTVCLVDSVGAQANRMEPMFKRPGLCDIVPQIVVKAGDHEVNILDAGHRAADAIVRFATAPAGASSLAKRLWDAFKAWQDHGDAEPLAKVVPTSLVFGVWDSRATQAKVPRIARSVIRAYGVKTARDGKRALTRSAQYVPPLNYVDEGLVDASLDKGKGDENPLAREGFRHNPASGAPGGILADNIRRDACLNLVALRSLGTRQRENESPEECAKRCLTLRRYIFGLALVALTHPGVERFNLREGCLLKIKDKVPHWKRVPFEGESEDTQPEITALGAKAFAEAAAKAFDPERFNFQFEFDKSQANLFLKLQKKDANKIRRNGSIVDQKLPGTPAGRVNKTADDGESAAASAGSQTT